MRAAPARRSGSGRRHARGAGRWVTCSTSPPGSPAASAPWAWALATSWRCRFRTGSRAPPPGSRAACSAPWSSRSCTTTARTSSRTSCRESHARVLVIVDRFGAVDHLANLEAVRPDLRALEHVVVVGDELPTGAARFQDLLDGDRVDTSVTVDPASPALVAYTSGTTADPKGVIQSHRALGAEVRAHLRRAAAPVRSSPRAPRRTGRPRHRHAARVAAARRRAANRST